MKTSDVAMSVDEALTHADEWAAGQTFYPGAQGWRVVCAVLAAEVRRLRDHIPDGTKMVGREPSGKEVLRNVFALCEGTEDLDTNTPNDFLSGRKFEAKAIRNAIGVWFTDECNSRKAAPAVEPAKPVPVECEPVAHIYLLNGTRFKISAINRVCGIYGLPAALNGQWVALVDATDNKHMQSTAIDAETHALVLELCDYIERDGLQPVNPKLITKKLRERLGAE